MKKVVIAAPEVHPLLYDGLTAMGFMPLRCDEKDKGSLYGNLYDAIGLVYTTYTRVDIPLLDTAPCLQFVARVGSGMENTDIAACTSRNIAIFNSPEGLAPSVGEHALALILSLLHHIVYSNLELKSGLWHRESNRGSELGGKCVGIMGMGNTGRALAKVLQGFDVRILYCDIIDIMPPYPNTYQVTEEAIQTYADIISIHLPLNVHTYHYINEQWLSRCERKPLLINTSRGSVVDTKALITSLQNNSLKGLGIDVYEDEPPVLAVGERKEMYDILFSRPNVIATPHIAGWSVESKVNMAQIILERISKFYE